MFIQIILSILIFPADAIVGGDNLVDSVPEQLCQIVPVENGQYLRQKTCSATIVGSRELLTAGHCGSGQHEAYFVDCVSGDQFLVPTEDNWTFLDENGPLNPMLAIKDLGRAEKDQALVKINSSFSVDGLGIATAHEQEALLEANSCYFLGTGINNAGLWGVPQKVKVDTQKSLDSYGSLVFLEAYPQVQAHDSGGSLVCENQVVAVIVAQQNKPKGSILTKVSSDLFSSGSLNPQACQNNTTSKAVDDAIEHLLGFEEVRHFLMTKKQQGYSVCYQGLTLGKNNYQYFKNFVSFELQKDGKIENRLMVLFQSASVQAHHSTGSRPWVILDTQKTIEALGQTLDVAIPQNSLSFQPLAENYFQNWNGDKKQKSMIVLGSSSSSNLLLFSWLKEVNVGGNIFTTGVSPQYGLVEKQGDEDFMLSNGSAFNKVLGILEDQLTETEKAYKASSAEIGDFIEQVSKVRR